MIKEVVIQRRMPPWHADPRYGKFTNDRRLTQDEIDKIVEWTDAGTPLGDKHELPPPRKFAEGWQIGQPDLVFQLRKPVKVPATGTVPYMYFTRPHELERGRLDPGGRSATGQSVRRAPHHRLFSRLPTATRATASRATTCAARPPAIRRWFCLPASPGRCRPVRTSSSRCTTRPTARRRPTNSKVGLILYKGPKGEKKAKPKRAAKTQP